MRTPSPTATNPAKRSALHMMPRRIPALESMARDMVGDSGTPDLFFVTDRGVVVMVARSFPAAHREWSRLAQRRDMGTGDPRGLLESALENRRTGVLASVEPESDEPGARLVVRDDSRSFGFNPEA